MNTHPDKFYSGGAKNRILDTGIFKKTANIFEKSLCLSFFPCRNLLENVEIMKKGQAVYLTLFVLIKIGNSYPCG